MGKLDYIEMADSIASLQSEKERLEEIISRIDIKQFEIDAYKALFNALRDGSVPDLMDGYGKMGCGEEDCSDGSLRTSYEKLANEEKRIINRIDIDMQNFLARMNNNCIKLSQKREEYQRQISNINTEISEIETRMANRLGGL